MTDDVQLSHSHEGHRYRSRRLDNHVCLYSSSSSIGSAGTESNTMKHYTRLVWSRAPLHQRLRAQREQRGKSRKYGVGRIHGHMEGQWKCLMLLPFTPKCRSDDPTMHRSTHPGKVLWIRTTGIPVTNAS